MIAGKHPTDHHPVQTLAQERSRGLAIWPHLSDDGEPDLTIICAGDLPAAVTHTTVLQLRDQDRGRVRVVNVQDLTVLGDPSTWPAGLHDDEVGHYYGDHAGLLIVTLGHPAAVWGLLGGRLHRPIEVIGWRESAGPLSQRQLAAVCGLDNDGLLHAAARVLKRHKVAA